MARALAWSVKASFRDYVSGVADGIEERSAGVDLDERGRYIFPSLGGDGETLKFGGWVRISAYRGILDVRVADPWIESDGVRRRVSIAHPRAERNPELPRLVLAEFEGADQNTPLLTFDGVRLLGDVYQVGAALDPIELIDIAVGDDSSAGRALER